MTAFRLLLRESTRFSHLTEAVGDPEPGQWLSHPFKYREEES
jgi:hypothetical protein